ncbi:hypothetical protein imdm_177 [gamma proteobacterium IMCC2047]|nr:hypothetical protein imdm_177 [gamma proteobacterium IMCC2047]
MKHSGRSFISNEEEKRSKLIFTPSIDELSVDDDESTSITGKLSHSCAETQIGQVQSNSVIAEWVNRVQQLFEGDDDASCFIREKLAEHKKSKIKILCEFTDQVYRNVEKRIKDKVKKRFPNGLPWWEVES